MGGVFSDSVDGGYGDSQADWRHRPLLFCSSDATGLPRDYEPHCCYTHQEPEANYAKWWHDVIRAVDVYVQSEGLEHPKPDGQSERHQHCYTNEMLHQIPRVAAQDAVRRVYHSGT
jgi:hypothetical protein